MELLAFQPLNTFLTILLTSLGSNCHAFVRSFCQLWTQDFRVHLSGLTSEETQALFPVGAGWGRMGGAGSLTALPFPGESAPAYLEEFSSASVPWGALPPLSACLISVSLAG